MLEKFIEMPFLTWSSLEENWWTEGTQWTSFKPNHSNLDNVRFTSLQVLQHNICWGRILNPTSIVDMRIFHISRLCVIKYRILLWRKRSKGWIFQMHNILAERQKMRQWYSMWQVWLKEWKTIEQIYMISPVHCIFISHNDKVKNVLRMI